MFVSAFSDQEALLNTIRVNVPHSYDFHFPATNLEIISGRQEGIYQWIAINFVLGKLGYSVSTEGSRSHLARSPTVGIMDMGGASLQIAFENSMNKEETKDSDIKVRIKTLLFAVKYRF